MCLASNCCPVIASYQVGLLFAIVLLAGQAGYTYGPSTSASQVLRFQVCLTTDSFNLLTGFYEDECIVWGRVH